MDWNIPMLLGGMLGATIALVHARLGQRLILDPVQELPDVQNRVLGAVFHLSSIYWFAAGIAVTWVAISTSTERWVVGVAIALYLTGALANFWATRGRHFGGFALLLSVGLISWGLML